MKKYFITLFILLSFILSACTKNQNVHDKQEHTDTTPVIEEITPSVTPKEEYIQEELIIPELVTEETDIPKDEIIDVDTDSSNPNTSSSEHSELYIPDVSADEIITYFNEVVLDSEFVTEGDPSVVQKWNTPIYYFLEGTPTEENLDIINSFTEWLNTLEGFPGMYETTSYYESNLQIHFCNADELVSIMGDTYTYMDGAVSFWYEENAIYDETICIRNDIDQYLRNSVILEEIYNGLGPVQDTMLRPDSLIYQEFSQPQELTAVDEVILKLLYHPDILCGMNSEECEMVIRQLYY